jgi:NADH:ubiquinone oxidoreductase subunit F (NADH-binding)/NADH:ubiquinone oxidoreductase subunit E
MPKTHFMRRAIDPAIDELARQFDNNPEAILSIFQMLQAQRGSLTREAIIDTARQLQIPFERAYGVATFYSMLAIEPQPKQIIRVCDGPACWLQRASEVRTAIEAGLSEDWSIERTSCLGLCDRAPAALVNDDQAGPLTSDRVSAIRSGWRGQATDYSQPRSGEVRVMLAHAGEIDPDSIESAIKRGAYLALEVALGRPPASIIDEVESAGLTGRGGAGFPAGRKWRFVAQADRSPKYIVCNADESEPLIFKDRVLIDTNPHQILEGIALAGYATGAQQAFIYIRGEYAAQADRLQRAIAQAEELGWLGDHIRGSDFSFHVHVHRGAGAYICGEETALLESLEGKRGEPRLRPPYPPTYGYQGLPTLVNNVETYAAVPSIIANGAKWFRSLTGASTPGTKLYMLLGQIKRPGLFEAPFGLTLRQIIDDFGGGLRDGSTFHFALTGGAAGTIVPASLLDVPIDYASAAKGVSLGAGAFLICDQTISPVALLRELLHFFEVESCGKCTPCRIGTRQAREILDRLVAGQTRPTDVAQLSDLAETLQNASFCGLGQSAAVPIKSALRQFPEAF